MTDQRQITYLDLNALTPDPANPRTHALDTIGESVARFGYVEPIVLDGRTAYIVSGHGRTEALKAARGRGEAPPDGVILDTGGAWLVPVVTGWASKDDAEARGALIALNRAGQLGGWADEALLDLLDTLSGSALGFEGVGFDVTDIDDLRARLEEAATADPRDYQGTRATPSMPDYAERYDEQGRRLIVLDYDRDDYAAVTTRLKALRDRTGAESNAEAVRLHLLDLIPDAEVAESEEAPA